MTSHTAAIIQARMGSSRLPGKVMLELGGRTVLSHVLDRAKAIEGVDTVCCAIPHSSDCDILVTEAEECDAAVYRGSELDLLNRYYEAGKFLNANIVLRITSDCPLIDPKVCADVLRLREERQADFACNNQPRTWPHGLDCDAYTLAWLERANNEATEPDEREHVSPYVRNHSDTVTVNLPCPDGDLSHHRWTLDTEADYRFFQALFQELGEGPNTWNYSVPLAVVEAKPRISAINTE